MGRIQLVDVVITLGLVVTLDVELHNAKIKFAREFPDDARRIANDDVVDAEYEVVQ